MATSKRTTTSKSAHAPEPARKPKAPRQRIAPPEENGDDTNNGEGDTTQFVGAAARALLVLNGFRIGDRPLGNAELAERTKLPKPTVSRLTYTLARCGYLTYNPRFRVYELGPGAISLGNVAMAAVDIRQVARPLMRELARQANFNVGLGTLDGHLMVYTDACEGEGLVGLRLFAGSRIPVVTSAMGRAYLAGIDEAEREALLATLRPRYGDEWPSLHKAVVSAVHDVEKRGFCFSVGEWQKDINGVAAPIRNPSGGPVYVVNLGGPAYLLPESELHEELGPRVAALARTVTSAVAPMAKDLTEMARDRRS
jgi:DNA-binding IclR family transcriptional regulator